MACIFPVFIFSKLKKKKRRSNVWPPKLCFIVIVEKRSFGSESAVTYMCNPRIRAPCYTGGRADEEPQVRASYVPEPVRISAPMWNLLGEGYRKTTSRAWTRTHAIHSIHHYSRSNSTNRTTRRYKTYIKSEPRDPPLLYYWPFGFQRRPQEVAIGSVLLIEAPTAAFAARVSCKDSLQAAPREFPISILVYRFIIYLLRRKYAKNIEFLEPNIALFFLACNNKRG